MVWNGEQFCGSTHHTEIGVMLAIGEKTNFSKLFHGFHSGQGVKFSAVMNINRDKVQGQQH